MSAHTPPQELPQPLVPAEVDLRDFGFMPLDVLRLRDSDLAALASGDEFKAAVLLWCVAWHQVPAASLPKDDRLLARYVGVDAATWRRLKAEAMRGFVECSDGRLYHAIIGEKAREAWASKKSQRARTEAATRAREERRRAALVERGLLRDDVRDVERDVVQGTGTGTGILRKEEGRATAYAAARAPDPEPEPGIRRGSPPPDEFTLDEAPQALVDTAPPEANGQPPTKAGSTCRAMRQQAGLTACNPGDPRLLALIDQGATEAEFVDVAREAVAGGKGWAWVLKVVEARRADAARIALAPAPAAPAWHETRAGVVDMACRLGLEAHDPTREGWERYRRGVVSAAQQQGVTA